MVFPWDLGGWDPTLFPPETVFGSRMSPEAGLRPQELGQTLRLRGGRGSHPLPSVWGARLRQRILGRSDRVPRVFFLWVRILTKKHSESKNQGS